MGAPVFVVGDVHGELDKLTGLLQDAGLAGPGRTWTGADAVLWFIGDFTDRGPDGVGVLDLVMRLQWEASAAGGSAQGLIGNHEAMLLSALRFGNATFPGLSGTFLEVWALNGGQADDLARLRPEHVDWICSLEAMALVDGTLLVHADATSYLRYGRTIEDVSGRIRAILRGDAPFEWATLLDDLAERHAFERDPASADRFLAVYGGERIVHGHTPLPYVLGVDPSTVTEPYVYADGRCVNVDGGMFAGGPGFVFRLED